MHKHLESIVQPESKVQVHTYAQLYITVYFSISTLNTRLTQHGLACHLTKFESLCSAREPIQGARGGSDSVNFLPSGQSTALLCQVPVQMTAQQTKAQACPSLFRLFIGTVCVLAVVDSILCPAQTGYYRRQPSCFATKIDQQKASVPTCLACHTVAK